MSEGQRLQFVEPSAQAFVDALIGLPAPVSAVLVGEGPLATEITAKATALGVALDTHPHLPKAAALGQTRFLVLTERDGDRLGEQLLGCMDLTDIQVIAPVTARHFSCMPLFVVSIPKAGTHLVYELAQALGYAPGVVLPDFPKPQTWYCVEYNNSHTVPRDFFVDTVRRAPFGNRHHPISRSPVLFGYRHPLDILVSEAHYYHREGNTAFAGYLDGLDFGGRVQRLMDDEWLLGSLRQRVGSFLPWLSFPNVIPASFEELVGAAGGGSAAAQHHLIWSILLKLQVDGCVAEVATRLYKRDSPTFREGKIGVWRSQLSPALRKQLVERCGDIVTAFGYSTKTEANLLPEMAAQHAARPLRYASADFDRMPLTVVPDFMGCNLVRYAKQFYAVPSSAGTIAINELSAERLARLPVAETLSALKAILLLGRKAHDRQLAQIADAGNVLAAGRETLAYWKEYDTPHVFEKYKGYNLVAWQGRYIALRQSIGPVDLSQDISSLMTRHALGDILVSHEVDDLISHIDGISSTTRLKSELDTQLGELRKEQGVASERLDLERAEQAKREADLEHRIDALKSELDTQLGELRKEQGVASERLDLERAGQAKREADLEHRIDALKSELDTQLGELRKEQGVASERLDLERAEQAKREADLEHRIDALEGNAFVRLGRFLSGLLWKKT